HRSLSGSPGAAPGQRAPGATRRRRSRGPSWFAHHGEHLRTAAGPPRGRALSRHRLLSLPSSRTKGAIGMRRSIFRTAAVLTICLSGACSIKEAGPAKADSTQAKGSEPTAVTITATDYAFELPAQIPAGVITFKLVSKAKELHHAVVIRLDQGKTVNDMRDALKQPGPPP